MNTVITGISKDTRFVANDMLCAAPMAVMFWFTTIALTVVAIRCALCRCMLQVSSKAISQMAPIVFRMIFSKTHTD